MTKVATVDAKILAYPDANDFNNIRRTILVRVETTDGIVGWGEGIAMWPEACKATALIVEEGLAPLVRGEDPADPRALWQKMRGQTWWYGEGGIAGFALSAIDMALWDIAGKIAGKPLYEMLGGLAHQRLPANASSHVNKATMTACVDEVIRFFQAGFNSVKLGFAKKGLSDIGGNPDKDVAFIAALRTAVGPDKEILVDIGNGVRWDVETAIHVTRRMAEHGIGWIEEPLYPTNWDGYRRLKQAVTVPIASGEREWTAAGYQHLLETGTVDVVGVDPARVEGITGFTLIDQLAGKHNKTVNAHAWSTAVTTAASLHLSLASQNTRLFELKPFEVVVQQDLIADPIWHVDGFVYPIDKPGLGISVNEAVVEKLSA
ncbi:MAG: mandelate racemase/muconate lactonizing enzyme family protein [Alphaproteobacteria bacterium]